MALSQYFRDLASEVENMLDRLTPPAVTHPTIINEAMRYSLMAGGKRLRPILAVAGCEAVGGKRATALPFSAAVEMIHTYTLIHDDLPALDNDDLRRGIPTSHKKFGEATAILAGDALLTLAFEVMTDKSLYPGLPAETLLHVSTETANAIGGGGTIGGQVVDLEMEGAEADIAGLEYIHTHKTGKLIVASIRGGAMLGGATGKQLKALTDYGKSIGLAFQVVDDILDVEGTAEQLGKNVGMDEKQNKMTYPSALGMDESKILAARLIDRAIDSLAIFGGDGAHLVELARYIASRAS
ncbi:(2E,6E)-farnesyl diphosphate synthase [hydrothermal vent metagenome]|uniref:(2E,6E)-farnesyl diphosphate synthase n=1 Tax=hydrothermal vent metagenome TaxID=652676 RepID=A0A3B1BZL1_9ZZZZ